MSVARTSTALVLSLGLLSAACHREALRLEDEDEEGPTIVSVQRFEITGTFDALATAAQAAVTGQGGPAAVRSEGQVRFRNRAGRLTLRAGDDGTVRVELVLRVESSAGDQLRWQQHFQAIARLRGIGRRIVNGQPVE